MKFFLDCLYLTLIILCVYLLFRLIRSRMLLKHKSPVIHPVLLPIEHLGEEGRTIKLTYELPYDTHVSITLKDLSENLLDTFLDKDQKSGFYYIQKELPAGQDQFFLHFISADCSVMRRISL